MDETLRLRHRRENRLLRRAEFQRVFREGCRRGARGLTVVVADSPTGVSRLGLAVSRKVSKRAVDRNRVRRLIREAFRLSQQQFARPIDVVVIPRPGYRPAHRTEVESALQATVRQALRGAAAKGRSREGRGRSPP